MRIRSCYWLSLICLAMFVPAEFAFTQTVQVYETTANASMLLSQQSSVSFSTGTGSGSYTVDVWPSNVLQPWDGVGGAMTDSAATVIAALPSSQQTTLLLDLFSPTSGIGLNMIRLPMGASDMSASGDYSYDDMPAGETDPTLANFSIAHDTTAIIPLVQSAISINSNVKLIAEPWSPPAWMKTNGSMNGVTGASQSTSQILSSDFPYLANYFVDFIQAYANEGLSIYAVSPQNEPLNTQSGYPSAILTASDEASFIVNDLAPALSTAGLSSVKIFGLEDNWADTSYAHTVIDSTALSYIAGTSFHWYSGTVSEMSTVESYDSSLGTWFTESTGTVSCSGGAGTCPTLTGSTFSASGFATQMEELTIGVPRNSGRSILGWNLALNQNEGPQNGGCYNCVGLVTVNGDTTPASLYFNTTYYALGHIGKFVTPGANVIGTSSQGTTGIQDVAFVNPNGSIVLVVFNGASSSTTFSVSWNSEYFNYTLPAGAAATFEWSPS